MRAGTLLLAFTASIILGTADIVHNRHADYLKPEALVEIGIPDATSTMNVTDAVLPRVVESLTNERLEARLIDSRSLERRRGRAGRGGRGGRTRRPARKTRPKKKTQKKKTKAPKKKAGPQKKKTGTRNRTGAQKNKTGTQKKKTGTQKKKTGTQKKKTGTQKKKNQAAKSCPAKTKPKGKVGARELEHSLVGRAPGGKGPASNTRWQCENKCRAKIRTVGEDPCAALKGQKSFVPCAKPSEFNIPYFVNAARRARRVVRPNKCLFYTNGLSDAAQAYARKNRLTTIWDIWRGPLMTKAPYKVDNPLRCIFADNVLDSRNPRRQKYFETMSTAMATMCSGKVTFMDRNIVAGGSGRIKQAGIWGHNEFPRLRNNPQVTSIDAIGMFTRGQASTHLKWDDWWVSPEPTWGNENTRPAALAPLGG